jgi:hypothetical protein
VSVRCLDRKDAAIPNLESNGPLMQCDNCVSMGRLLQPVVNLQAIQVECAYFYIPWALRQPCARKVFLL